jgi:hypothetical protein
VIAAKVTSTSAGMAARWGSVRWLDDVQLPFLSTKSSSCHRFSYAGAPSASGLVKSTQSMTVPIQHTGFGSSREAEDQGIQLTSHPEQVIRQPPA